MLKWVDDVKKACKAMLVEFSTVKVKFLNEEFWIVFMKDAKRGINAYSLSEKDFQYEKNMMETPTWR